MEKTTKLILIIAVTTIIFKYPKKQKLTVKTSWNGYASASSSTGKVQWKRTELNLWIKTLIRWN